MGLVRRILRFFRINTNIGRAPDRTLKSGIVLQSEKYPVTTAGQIQMIQNLVELNDKLFGNEIITADDWKLLNEAKKAKKSRKRRKLSTPGRIKRTKSFKSKSTKRTEKA